MRAVLDTVVFVRALINPHSRAGRPLFGDLVGRYTLVVSPGIVEEILDVVYRPLLRRRFPQMASPPRVEAILDALRGAEIVERQARLQVCRDPGDDKFIECAVEGGATYVVTEDRDLLDMQEFRGIRLLTVAEFLDVLTGDPR